MKLSAPVLLGIVAAAALLMKSMGEASDSPGLRVIPGGKSPKPPKKKDPYHAVELAPATTSHAALPADTRSSAERAAAQPVPADQPEELAPPAKPKAPSKRKHAAPSAAALAKPAKRSGAQAASDLKDYLDGGGEPGSRANRSDFVKSAQRDMGGITADGVYGPKTRQRASALGVDIEH